MRQCEKEGGGADAITASGIYRKCAFKQKDNSCDGQCRVVALTLRAAA